MKKAILAALLILPACGDLQLGPDGWPQRLDCVKNADDTRVTCSQDPAPAGIPPAQ